MKIGIKLDQTALDTADDLLAKIDIQFRGPIVKKSLNAVGQIVVSEAKRRVVKGDPRHNPTKKPLKQTIGKITRQKNNVTYTIVGAKYPEGAHAHFVEGYKNPKRVVISRGPRKGEDTGLRAIAKPFMAPAVDATKSQQTKAFTDTAQKELAKIKGNG